MPSKKITTPIKPGKVYHIYNRGNNYQDVYFKKTDYSLFLEKLDLYLLPYCQILAYALLKNHYHLLIRVNDDVSGLEFSKQFGKFMLSYTNKINWREKRKGSLFVSYFRRILVEDESYLKRLVYYINMNPENHEIIDDFKSYKYSSYQALISKNPTKLSRAFVLDLFGSLEELKDYHQYLHDLNSMKKYLLEED